MYVTLLLLAVLAVSVWLRELGSYSEGGKIRTVFVTASFHLFFLSPKTAHIKGTSYFFKCLVFVHILCLSLVMLKNCVLINRLLTGVFIWFNQICYPVFLATY